MQIVGIVNITTDSFSDGGRFLAAPAAIAQAQALLRAGADIIELGPASSNPDGCSVPPDEEQRRLAPVIAALGGASLSIDSSLPQTHRYGLEQGVAMLNDIRGFPDAQSWPALAAGTARLVVMHSIQGGHRADRSQSDAETVFSGILRFFESRVAALIDAGIAADRIILDPGMGFFLGSTPAPSLLALRRLPILQQRFGLPLMISVSRKSFLGGITGQAVGRRGAATLGAELWCALQGVDYIRTHDAGALADAWSVIQAIEGRGASPAAPDRDQRHQATATT